MHSKQKGAIGETAVIADLHKKGYFVFTSFEDILPFDLVVSDSNNKLYKVQVKYASIKDRKITLNLRTCMSNKNLNYEKRYTVDEVDVFAVYVPELDECFYISSSILGDHVNAFMLRTEPPKNNQTKGVNLCENFKEFPR